MLWWMRQLLLLLLQRTHPWPHQDGAGPGIVEGGPHRGAPAVVVAVVTGAIRVIVLAFSLPLPLPLAVVVARSTEAIVLAFPLPLPLSLAFAAIVGVRNRRGRGCLRTW
jgi:hypothetical protein